MRPIVLTGMMGAGKTAIAAELGVILDRRVVDLDVRIEEDNGLSIRDIFETFGQAAFRERERVAFEALVRAEGIEVVALGGGAFIEPAFRRVLGMTDALTVYLHATADVLGERLQSERDSRPLLSTPDWEARLRELYAVRDPIYRSAELIVETGGRSVEEIAQEIVDVAV